jgi:hypothetical protein
MVRILLLSLPLVINPSPFSTKQSDRPYLMTCSAVWSNFVLLRIRSDTEGLTCVDADFGEQREVFRIVLFAAASNCSRVGGQDLGDKMLVLLVSAVWFYSSFSMVWCLPLLCVFNVIWCNLSAGSTLLSPQLLKVPFHTPHPPLLQSLD